MGRTLCPHCDRLYRRDHWCAQPDEWEKIKNTPIEQVRADLEREGINTASLKAWVRGELAKLRGRKAKRDE